MAQQKLIQTQSALDLVLGMHRQLEELERNNEGAVVSEDTELEEDDA